MPSLKENIKFLRLLRTRFHQVSEKEKVKRSDKAASPGEASSEPSLKEKIKLLTLLMTRFLQVSEKEKVKRSDNRRMPSLKEKYQILSSKDTAPPGF
jgi:hypothetical protein